MEKYLVILIIVILFYLLYKYCIQIDNFGDTPVLDAALVNSIKTLGVIATDLQTDGLKVMGEIVLQNKHVLKSVGTTGAAGDVTPAMLELREKPSNNLASMKVDGLEVTGTCNLIPRGMILAWNYTDADITNNETLRFVVIIRPETDINRVKTEIDPIYPSIKI